MPGLDINTLTYRELQEECRNAELKASGSAATLRKRLLARRSTDAETSPDDEDSSSSDTEPAAKKQKRVTEDLVCPITYELPFDPVTAEDGRIYERAAIEQHIAKSQQSLKSPMTNEAMGPRLLPALQTKNHINTLVNMGVITGDLASNWKDKVEEKKRMEELQRKAERGDLTAMIQLGYYIYSGENGFKKDYTAAYAWCKTAHHGGSVIATHNLGVMHHRGEGVAKNHSLGVFYLTDAARRGHGLAASKMGMALAEGIWGLEKSPHDAIMYLQMALACNGAVRYINDKDREGVQKILDDLLLLHGSN